MIEEIVSGLIQAVFILSISGNIVSVINLFSSNHNLFLKEIRIIFRNLSPALHQIFFFNLEFVTDFSVVIQ
jgi:hypothetical protein